MPRWKALPTSLDERAQKLVVQLRWLKDRSGLSLLSLQAKTGYSRSSWVRYLNGRALPPPQAVEALARVGGVDPTRILALRDVAAEAWRQEAGTAETIVTPEPRRTRHRTALIGACTAVAVAVLLVGLLVTAPWKDGGATAGKGPKGAVAGSSSSAGAFVYKPGKTYSCTVQRKDGRLYAGHSTTAVKVFSQGTQGWDVVEIQCLLRHRGFDPGVVDGSYGPNTARAVKLFQQKAGVYPDGVVGRHTWQALRK